MSLKAGGMFESIETTSHKTPNKRMQTDVAYGHAADARRWAKNRGVATNEQ